MISLLFELDIKVLFGLVLTSEQASKRFDRWWKTVAQPAFAAANPVPDISATWEWMDERIIYATITGELEAIQGCLEAMEMDVDDTLRLFPPYIDRNGEVVLAVTMDEISVGRLCYDLGYGYGILLADRPAVELVGFVPPPIDHDGQNMESALVVEMRGKPIYLGEFEGKWRHLKQGQWVKPTAAMMKKAAELMSR